MLAAPKWGLRDPVQVSLRPSLLSGIPIQATLRSPQLQVPNLEPGLRVVFTDLFAFWTFMERFSGLAEIGKCPDLGFSKTYQGIDVHGANKNRYSGSREPQS
ncbi:hypothetical protein FYZ42_11740 [Mobiluncus mulieris]|nr:hypothetical protein [Mobiluncus mulieris]PNL44290.1 hypothetical protein CEP82_011240 [Mobiluncus mulieris]